MPNGNWIVCGGSEYIYMCIVAASLVLLVPKLHCSVLYDIIVLCQTSKTE